MYGYGYIPDPTAPPKLDPDSIPHSGVVKVTWKNDNRPGLYRILYLHSRTRRRLLVPWIDGKGARPGGSTIWAEPEEFATVERV